MATKEYRNNHYVPEWYQKKFLSADGGEAKFYYLDLKPETITTANGTRYKRKDMMRWGPDSCFKIEDLYTTKLGNFESTEIEEKFFGQIDTEGHKAVEYFSKFQHPDVDPQSFHNLLLYMSTQKLRTPKGLKYLASKTQSRDKNELLFMLQRLQSYFCALWTECVWQLADCKSTDTKLILSDHPVTVYNKGCFPQSALAKKVGDPEVWLNGTHTYFPLSEERVLILTNLSWVRCPYGNPMKERPNPKLFRTAMFNFTSIQTHRELTELEVLQINYITKIRAERYVAAREKEWLYPEKKVTPSLWPQLGDSYLLMPDPRSVTYSTSTMVGYENGRSETMDEYGRRPGQKGYSGESNNRKDWNSFLAFQGEYARRFGPKRRGRSFELNRISNEEDSDDYHAYHLGLERTHRKR
ncbi:DUF4238 domain-containing protein [Pseudomonas sp. 24 E 1]|uniref:DUF4238 domain-containing protein n=1 Tax=Pseudomonas sp. 24 E 1 TaxID=1844094 RepID=UPI0013DA882A|nr:DUF4238 domain-containing protein [Pseudomonas sp. 24 E 1]